MKTNKKTLYPILLVLLFICLTIPVNALTIGEDINYDVGNETYCIDNGTMIFSRIIIDATWIKFNNTGFNISSTNNITIRLVNLYVNPYVYIPYTSILRFKANTTGGTVYFDITGFKPTREYHIYKNNTLYAIMDSDSNGHLNFSNSVWSEYLFDIRTGNDTEFHQTTNLLIEDLLTNILPILIIITILTVIIWMVYSGAGSISEWIILFIITIIAIITVYILTTL